MSADPISLVVLTAIDKYEVEKGEGAVDAKSSLYPALIASAMYETARLFKADKQNFSNIEEAAKSVANSMRDEDRKYS